jgi:hypothetical protein
MMSNSCLSREGLNFYIPPQLPCPQPPPLEQGDPSQPSSLPQQACPKLRFDESGVGALSSFSTLALHLGQADSGAAFISCSSSKRYPHDVHLYS